MAETPETILCPYCGSVQMSAQRCNACGGRFDEHSRLATQIAMGPWYVRDEDKPFHPGCNYEMLNRWIQSGRVSSRTVIRGPTTQQFWEVAKRVQGVSHLVGRCYSCRVRVQPTHTHCPRCGASFLFTAKRDAMGLKFPTEADVAMGQRQIEQHRQRNGSETQTSTTDVASTGRSLLDEVLGVAVKEEADPGSRPETPSAAKPADQVGDMTTDAADNTDQPGSDTEDLPVTRRRSPSLTVALLVALNVVALAILIWFMMRGD